MRRAICILITTGLLLGLGVAPWRGQAQQGGKPEQARPEKQMKLHPQARLGSTPERKAAWDKLSAADKEKAMAKFNETLEKAMKKAEKERGKSAGEELATEFITTDRHGNRQVRPGKHARRGKSALKKGESASLLRPVAPGRGGRVAARQDARAVFQPASLEPGLFKPASFMKASFAPAAPRPARAAREEGSYNYAQIECRTIEQFVRNFYAAALWRQPYDWELQHWVATITQGQAQGHDPLMSAAQSFGHSIFASGEYAARGRSDYEFVYDLYKAWLQREPDQGGWDFWASVTPNDGRANVTNGFALSDEFHNLVVSLCVAGTADEDQDGLPESLENQVADAFTPFYHVSAGETDNFATFANTEAQTPVGLFGPNPISHFRVKPLGFGTDTRTGQLVSMLQIDYLTLWDHDSGNSTGIDCFLLSPALGAAVELINQPHALDNERSAVLVAAPTTGYGVYNTNASSYSAYEFFTTGHEGVSPFDQTRYLVPEYPVSAVGASHINLWLSKSKHATYPFNPHYYPQFEWWFIASVYDGIWLDCYYFNYDEWCFIQLYLADVLFYDCAVEKFNEQGGRYAFKRINVGEPRVGGTSQHPINASEFISHGEVGEKLRTPLRWFD